MDIIAVPLKPFGLAKARLASEFSGRQRAALGMATATHTVTAALDAVGSVSVVTSNQEVADWAATLGASVIDEGTNQPGGLDKAASQAVAAAGNGRWMIIHADLPLVTPRDVHLAWNSIPEGGTLLSPSSNGGTSVIGGDRSDMRFSYGPGSFMRHLAIIAKRPVSVLTRLGFLLDLDEPSDYRAAIAHPRGSWLKDLGSR